MNKEVKCREHVAVRKSLKFINFKTDSLPKINQASSDVYANEEAEQ